MPLGPFDTSVVVEIEVVEIVTAIVLVVRAEKLGLIERIVAIAIDAPERLEVVMPLVRADAAVAIVVEIVEARPASS